MSDLENVSMKGQRTRRNIAAMGLIAASAVIAGTVPVLANCGRNGKPVGRGCNCFLKGTTIRTADGGRKVEDLAIGDLLPTMFSGMRPIQWIGRYPFEKSDPSDPWVKAALPVRIARSALAPNVPHSDLYVTNGHGLFVDGVLVSAGSLINGTTITVCEVRESNELEFFHIKLEGHDVIYAEGAPCETLSKVTEKSVDFAEYFRRYGAPTSDAVPCVPVLSLCSVRSRLKSRFRSAISPWLDQRQTIDIIRDRLEERGIVLARQSALAR